MNKQTIEYRFNRKFGKKDIFDFHNDYNVKEDGWRGASMFRRAGCDDCGKCQNLREEHKEFLLKEISQAIQERDKEIVELAQWIIPHTPLKLSDTPASKYDEGYIDYQNHVLSNFKDFIKAINQEKL